MKRPKVRTFLYVVVSFSILCFGNIYCYADASVAPAQFLTDTSITYMVLQVIFFLILIIGLFFLIIKIIAQKNKLIMSGRAIKSIGGVALGQHKSLQVVSVGHSLFVVGIGENVQLLAKIDDPEEIKYIQDHLLQNNANLGFSSLSKWIQSKRATEPIEEEELSTSFQQIFQNKMENIAGRKKKIDELINEENYVDRLNDKK